MTVQELKEIVVEANKELPRRHMVLYSWGNVSAIDRDKGIIVIKPVGIPYDDLTTENVSVVDLQGNKVAGEKNPLNPSVDLDIHRALYENFPECNAIVHTHSTYATVMAQLHRDVPCLAQPMRITLPDPFPAWRLFLTKKSFMITNGIQAWRL